MGSPRASPRYVYFCTLGETLQIHTRSIIHTDREPTCCVLQQYSNSCCVLRIAFFPSLPPGCATPNQQCSRRFGWHVRLAVCIYIMIDGCCVASGLTPTGASWMHPLIFGLLSANNTGGQCQDSEVRRDQLCNQVYKGCVWLTLLCLAQTTVRQQQTNTFAQGFGCVGNASSQHLVLPPFIPCTYIHCTSCTVGPAVSTSCALAERYYCIRW